LVYSEIKHNLSLLDHPILATLFSRIFQTSQTSRQENTMNPNSYRSIQFSGLRFWLILLGIGWLLGTVGLGWIVKSVFILIALLVVTPVLAFLGLRWWLKRNLVMAECPVCGTESAGINNTQMRCPSCSEPLKVENNQFLRLTPPGTVDVSAIDVTVKQLKD
jgi:hypothetical protein